MNPTKVTLRARNDFASSFFNGAAKVRQIGIRGLRGIQAGLFQAIVLIASLPNRLRSAFQRQMAAHAQNQSAAPLAKSSTQDEPSAPPPAAQAISMNAPASLAPHIQQPEPKTFAAMTRRNPNLMILTACLIMGVVQVGVVALIVFMMRDAGYSSGWGDAAKYYLQCEKSAAAQQWGQ